MRLTLVPAFSAALLFTFSSGFDAQQALPTSQPGLIEIHIEDIKFGHGADHETNEANWVAAFERAKFPASFIALESITGRQQVWFTAAYESHAAIGNSMKAVTENKALAADVARFEKIDAEHVESMRIVQGRARPDLSHGTFPDISTQRFWEISVFRMRPGFEGQFAAAAKAYGAAAGRSAPKSSYRVYEVIAGMPAPTFIIFGSTAAFAEFDAALKEGDAIMGAMNAQEQEAMGKAVPGMLSVETQRFRLNPKMSYVPAEVKAKDPKFWTTTQ
jgi:hypothetical protein